MNGAQLFEFDFYSLYIILYLPN